MLTICLTTITLTTPGCLRYECVETDITCKPQALLPWLQSLISPLPTNGRVASFQKISSTEGGFTGPLINDDNFGQPAAIGDLDGDGVTELAVGAFGDDDGGGNRGAVWVLFMHPTGTVKASQKISSTQGGFIGPLANVDQFGIGVVSPGDVNGDGIPDLAVGAHLGNDGAGNRGGVHILFMNANGTVKAEQKISSTQGGLTGPLANNDRFGFSIAAPGDIDGDGVPDLAVSAGGDTDGGAVYVLFLNANGTVKAEQKISSTQGGLTGPVVNGDLFSVVAAPGDIDRDGVPDLAVGAYEDDDGGTNRGAVYVLFLNPNGTVRAEQKISSTRGGLTGTLNDNDEFGRNVASAGDLDLDGVPDIFAGAFADDDGGATTTADRGALYVLFLNADGTVKAEQKISATAGGFAGTLNDLDEFCRPAAVGDLNGDRVPDLIVGAGADDDGGPDRGAAYVLFLERQ